MNNTFTYNEIVSQPNLWLKEYEVLNDSKDIISLFLKNNNVTKKTRIIFSGAGTSAFIGDILEVLYRRLGYENVSSISTTDIISHPDTYFLEGEQTILVSFARSGNSPESVSTVDFANKICGDKVVHVVITCNENGQLAKNISQNDLLLLLPAETNDKGLAMTSSFSTMLLVGYLFIQIDDIENKETSLMSLVKNTKNAILDIQKLSMEVAKLDFNRAVFLGSAELKGVAQECHLKLQELTDGRVLCKYDSFLGFRHGPQAVLDNKTIVVYLLSNDQYAFSYERDLVKHINSKNNDLVAQIAVSQNKVNEEGVSFDHEVVIGEGDLAFVSYALIGQMLGFFKSLEMGLNPDSPAVSGNISRVVEGVVIYDHPTLKIE